MKGIKFIGKTKALINLKKHAEIMEDAIARIAIKEAKLSGEFIAWVDAWVPLDRLKH